MSYCMPPCLECVGNVEAIVPKSHHATVLVAATEQFHTFEESNPRNVYFQSLDSSSERAKRMEETIAFAETAGREELDKLSQQVRMKLDALKLDIDRRAKELEELTRNVEEQTKANRVSIREIDRLVSNLERE